MAIPGVTDRPRLPRLGKIRLGRKKKGRSGAEYPAATDYFVLDDVPELIESLGERPTEILVQIPVDWSEEDWFPTSRSFYRQSGLFCRSKDGETAVRIYEGAGDDGKPRDPQGHDFIESQGLDVPPGTMFEMPCPGETCVYFKRKLCRNLGRLMVMLPESKNLGVYEIDTSSFNSIRNLISSARMIRAVQCGLRNCEHKGYPCRGRLAMIPLVLRLKPLQVQPEGKKKTVYVLDLVYRGGLDALRQHARAALPAGEPDRVPDDDVPEDLYPEAGAKGSAVTGESPRTGPSGDSPPDESVDDSTDGLIDDLKGRLAKVGKAAGLTQGQISVRVNRAAKADDPDTAIAQLRELLENWRELPLDAGPESPEPSVDNGQPSKPDTDERTERVRASAAKGAERAAGSARRLMDF